MSKMTLRRDELVAEATAVYSAAPGSAVIADMMADFAMMIAARTAVRMMPPPEVATLRARVARVEKLVRSAYAEGWVDGNNGQYDTAADAWEWAAARAALSAETP